MGGYPKKLFAVISRHSIFRGGKKKHNRMKTRNFQRKLHQKGEVRKLSEKNHRTQISSKIEAPTKPPQSNYTSWNYAFLFKPQCQPLLGEKSENCILKHLLFFSSSSLLLSNQVNKPWNYLAPNEPIHAITLYSSAKFYCLAGVKIKSFT